MTELNYSYKKRKLNFIDILFVVFCLVPFIIPNPIVTTNNQPYAAILGTLVIGIDVIYKNNGRLRVAKTFFFGIAGLTLAISIIVLFTTDITVLSFRALFNYYSVAVIPLAFCLILRCVNEYPEKLIKTLILVWFIVATIQFFVDRRFMTSIISGVRFSYSYRGVVGLASEPSFLGIACFYFLHMLLKFKRNQMVYFALILIMGIVYAQSMMGVLFIGAFIFVYLLDLTNTKKGFYIWIGAVIAIICFWYILNTVLVDTRLYQLVSLFMQEGVEGVLNDASAETRYSSLIDSIRDSFANFLLPLGFENRIGSGYGGFLCELGFFALPILWSISRIMSLTFKKRLSQILYFVIVTVLMFNNTQIGNPLLLVVLASNIAFAPNVTTINCPEKRRNI